MSNQYSSTQYKGAIDCDIHPRVPTPRALARYMDDHWRDTVELRGIETWDSIAYPPNAPLTSRPDWRKAGADTEPAKAAKETLDRFGFAHAICNSLFPVQTFRDENLAAAFARALNDWLAAEWLDKDPRLRGSAVLPIQSVERSVEEIERRAGDKRFVQVLMLAMGEHPLGKSHVLADLCRRRAPRLHRRHPRRQQLPPRADRLGLADLLPRGLRRPVAGLPHPARQPHLRGRVRQIPQAQGGADRIRASPGCRPACGGSSKFWRGVRNEVPWIDRSPEEFVRDHVRLTIQPFDAPPSAAHIGRIMDQLQSDDMLLFSTDFPHWQFDGDEMLPAGLSPALRQKILIDNPLATYPRLGRSS